MTNATKRTSSNAVLY